MDGRPHPQRQAVKDWLRSTEVANISYQESRCVHPQRALRCYCGHAREREAVSSRALLACAQFVDVSYISLRYSRLPRTRTEHSLEEHVPLFATALAGGYAEEAGPWLTHGVVAPVCDSKACEAKEILGRQRRVYSYCDLDGLSGLAV